MQQNTFLQQAINTGIKSNIDYAILCEAPHYYKTDNEIAKKMIHSLKYGSFYILCHHGYFDIITHFLKKHEYANKYIFDGALNSIISGQSDCAIELFKIINKRNIDINGKFGILLNNTVCSHFRNNNTNDLTVVKSLIDFGANTSCCVTHPLINAVKKSTSEVIDYLFDRQLVLKSDHIDYLNTEQLEKIAMSMIRYATKRNDPIILDNVKKLAQKCVNDIYSIEYTVLKKKIQQNQSDLKEFAISLSNQDENFIIKTKHIGLKNTEFIKLRELIKLNYKLYNMPELINVNNNNNAKITKKKI